MKITILFSSPWRFLLLIFVVFLPSIALADEVTTGHFDLKEQFVGYLSLVVTLLAYVGAMTEDVHLMKKSEPMILGSVLTWFAICIYYGLQGHAKVASLAFESNLLAYIELLLFILVSMTYLNTLNERGVFDGLRIYLLNKQFSYRQLFWITGGLAFILSTIVNGLTVGLLMGSIAVAVGKRQPKFVALACVNIVVAANAGGTMSPLGGISTLFVWQKNILHFTEFFSLTIPCLINFIVPACIMHFSVPKETPAVSQSSIALKRGSKRIVGLFILTLIITVSSNVLLELPPAAGMMAGLALLQMFNFYLTNTEKAGCSETEKSFDIFKSIADVEWDTLLFFYGVMVGVGGLSFIGYLGVASQHLYGTIDPTLANILVGIASAFVDNGTIMLSVLTMSPDISQGQWLLVTLTAGVGGSMLAIGSAAGVGLMGQAKGIYTFTSHLKWTPVIALGYAGSIAAHFLIYGRYF